MAELSKGQPLRNSTGKLKEVAAKGVDIGPNYLRASSGSCHDFCKYGTPHEFKAKPKRPARRRSTPSSEITVEIFVSSDKRSAKAIKPSSVVPHPKSTTKLEVAVSGKSPKSIRQQDSSSKKVRSSHVSGKIDPQTQLDVKSLSPDLSNSPEQESPLDVKALSSDLSNSVKQESSPDVNLLSPDSSKSVIMQDSSLEMKSLSPDSSNSVRRENSSISVKQESPLDVISESLDSSKSVKKESSMDVKPSPHDSLISVKLESSSNSVKKELSLDVISESPDSSKSVKQESSLDVKSSPPDSSISAKQKSSSVVKSSPPDSSISVKQESSSDVKSSSYSSLKKGSSSQRNSSNASKSTLQNVQSRRKFSSSNVSGSLRQSASKESKPMRSPRLMSGSISKASTVGRRSSLTNDKAPLKNDTSTNLSGIALKSKSNRASTEQSSPSNLLVRKSGNGSSGKRNTESKIQNDLRKSKEASKKNMGSLPLNTRKNLKTAVENSLPSSTTIALTPNLPGTKVARISVRKNIIQREGSRNTEATSEELNGYSAPKKPENEKVPEKTLHMIEAAAASNQQSPGPGDDNGSDITQPQLQFSPGSIDSLCQSKSPFSSQDAVETNESESEYSESEAEDSVVSYSRKGRVLGHEGNESGQVKLKFRRGKVVDLQSETNSPKRLRFRRRKSLGKDQCEADGVKVVLRHQDLQEKKSEKGLLNVVIEETASKLVETRKSKVKALVGAFETVISLQESKSAGEKLSPYSSPGR